MLDVTNCGDSSDAAQVLKIKLYYIQNVRVENTVGNDGQVVEPKTMITSKNVSDVS